MVDWLEGTTYQKFHDPVPATLQELTLVLGELR
jgi:hypothetical protein